MKRKELIETFMMISNWKKRFKGQSANQAHSRFHPFYLCLKQENLMEKWVSIMLDLRFISIQIVLMSVFSPTWSCTWSQQR